MSQLAATGLEKSYGSTPVLRGVDLEIARGDLTVLLGASGSGKSTTLRLVAGFERVDAGEIRIGEIVVASRRIHLDPDRRHLGYVAQDGALFPHLTVLANVGFGLPRRQRKRGRVRDLIAMVGLEGLDSRYPHQLSGGQQRRVALARALAIEPELLLLDEPFSSLDTALRAAVREEVIQIVRRADTTTLLVTHDQTEALSMADTVAVLHAGSVAQHAAPADLYQAPIDADIAAFLGPANFVDATTDGSATEHALTALGPVLLHPDAASGVRDLTVLLRPEQVTVYTADDDRAGTPGRVVSSTYYGSETLVTVQPEHGNGQAGVILARTDTPLATGTRVRLSARGPAMAWPRAESSAISTMPAS